MNRQYKKIILAYLQFTFVSVVFLFLSGCDVQPDSPKSVADNFWKAVQQRDMETAKNLATWDTVDYLKYLKTEKIHPERFELGEVMTGDTTAEVVTTLFSSKQGKSGVKVPGKTQLVKTEQGWRVDVKKTLASVVRHTVDNVFEQLNGFMREGVKELDKAFSESLKEIEKALEEGANELRNELSKPSLKPPINKTLQKPLGREI